MRSAFRPLGAILTMVAVLVGSGAATPALAEDGIAVRDAWARAPAVPGRNGAAFLTIVNRTAGEIRLVGAQSPACARVELHESVMADGVMKMVPQAAIPVPAGGTTVLEPGGLHLMLMQAKPAVKPGGTITLTLAFADAGRQTVRARVVAPGRTPDMQGAE